MPSFFKKVKSCECWSQTSTKKDVEIKWSQRKPAAASTASKLRLRTFRFRAFLFRSEAFPFSLLSVFFVLLPILFPSSMCFGLSLSLRDLLCAHFFFEALPFRKNSLLAFFLFFALFLSFLQAPFLWRINFSEWTGPHRWKLIMSQKPLSKSCDFKINSVDDV